MGSLSLYISIAFRLTAPVGERLVRLDPIHHDQTARLFLEVGFGFLKIYSTVRVKRRKFLIFERKVVVVYYYYTS